MLPGKRQQSTASEGSVDFLQQVLLCNTSMALAQDQPDIQTVSGIPNRICFVITVFESLQRLWTQLIPVFYTLARLAM